MFSVYLDNNTLHDTLLNQLAQEIYNIVSRHKSPYISFFLSFVISDLQFYVIRLSILSIPNVCITWQLCAQKFLMICCSFNWLSGIRFYQECKKLKCWLLTYWDHICIISFGIIDCCKHEKNRPNIGAVSNVWLRRSGETYKTWYPIILRQTCSSLARQCKIGG